MDMVEEIDAAFREAFDLAPDAELKGLAYRGHPNWTSLGHMSLVAALESRFDIIMEADDILDMSSYGKAVEIISRYRNAD
jgi:acyl carrier protein